jgi:uncharacterized protein YndB with AHSA1/START domain
MRGRKGPSFSVDIKAPRDTVFAYVADISRHPEWGMDLTEVNGPKGPAQEGFTYQTVGTLKGKRNESTVFVSEVQPPQRLEFEAQDSSGIVGHEFTFEATNDGSTFVTRTMYAIVQPATAPLRYLFNRGAINRNFNGALQRLKERMERG